MRPSEPIRDVACRQVIPTLVVGDLAAALDHYGQALGFRELWRYGDPPVHAAVAFGDVEVHLSAGPPNPGGAWLYLVVDDVDRVHQALRERGAQVVHAPADQSWSMREMAVKDLVGNDLTFASHGAAREPKLAVRREAFEARIEARLLALVRDLAVHKEMTVGELLEETLLHTFEEVRGGGVASPHTPAQHRRIAELKHEHGIDYDTHASYRFEERGEGGEGDAAASGPDGGPGHGDPGLAGEAAGA